MQSKQQQQPQPQQQQHESNHQQQQQQHQHLQSILSSRTTRFVRSPTELGCTTAQAFNALLGCWVNGSRYPRQNRNTRMVAKANRRDGQLETTSNITLPSRRLLFLVVVVDVVLFCFCFNMNNIKTEDQQVIRKQKRYKTQNEIQQQ